MHIKSPGDVLYISHMGHMVYVSSFLLKTPMDDVDDDILLFRRHLIVTRKTEASFKDVDVYVLILI